MLHGRAFALRCPSTCTEKEVRPRNSMTLQKFKGHTHSGSDELDWVSKTWRALITHLRELSWVPEVPQGIFYL